MSAEVYSPLHTHEIFEPLSPRIREEPKKCIYHGAENQSRASKKVSPESWRRFIRRKLRHEWAPRDANFDLLRDNSQQASGIKSNVRQSIWDKLQINTAEKKEEEDAANAPSAQNVLATGSRVTKEKLGRT